MVVKILGAGISGLACAIRLAQSGKDVVVYEKNSEVGQQMNENTQALRNYEGNVDLLIQLKNWGLNLNYFKPISKIVKYAPSGRNSTMDSGDKPVFYVIKRGPQSRSLDSQMYDQAVHEGVKFKFNVKVPPKECDIIATGPIYKNGVVYGVETKGWPLRQDKMLLFMDNRYAPGGYIYIIPYGDEISVSIVVVNAKADIRASLFRFIAKNNVYGESMSHIAFTNEFSGQAYYNVPKSAKVDNHLVVGGAAGFVEAARGFGNIYAIKSGLYAADALIKGVDYDTLWMNDFGNELMAGFKRRVKMTRMGNRHYERMIKYEVSVKAENYRAEKVKDYKPLDGKYLNALNDWRKTHDLGRYVREGSTGQY